MVQTTLDDIRRDGSARLFRDSAMLLAEPVLTGPRPDGRTQAGPAVSDDDKDRPRAFDPNGNSDQAILMRKSGYRVTDEKTRQGYENEQEHRSEARATERLMAQAAAKGSSSLYQTVKSWWSSAAGAVRNAWNTASDYVADTFNGAVETLSGVKNYVTGKISNLYEGAKDLAGRAGTAISNGFTSYVAEPLAGAWGWAKEKAAGVGSWASSTYNSWFGDSAPQQAAAQPQQAQPRPAAHAQPLAGQKSNPETGFSLSGAFDSAVDGVSSWWNGPSAKPAPAPRPNP